MTSGRVTLKMNVSTDVREMMIPRPVRNFVIVFITRANRYGSASHSITRQRLRINRISIIHMSLGSIAMAHEVSYRVLIQPGLCGFGCKKIIEKIEELLLLALHYYLSTLTFRK